MDEWLFWEQYSHEPYIAVCRYQIVYLGKPMSNSIPTSEARLFQRWRGWSSTSPRRRVSWSETRSTLADVSLVAYTRVAHEGGFHLDGYARSARWIADARGRLACRRRAENFFRKRHGQYFFRHHPPRPPRRRRTIVEMLADDPLGRGRERIRTTAAILFQAFEKSRVTKASGSWLPRRDGSVVGCLQLCILPGLSSQGASRAPIEDVRVDDAAAATASASNWCNGRSARRARGCNLVELLTHHTRVDAQRFYKRLGFRAAISA